MQLPTGYFEESSDLVQRACGRIAKACQKELSTKCVKS